MGINVYYNYYLPESPLRAAEVLSCFGMLLADRHIDRIVVLSERSDYPPNDRVTWVAAPARPNFADFFNAIEQHSTNDDVNVVLNSDCCFHSKTTKALNRIRHGEAYCLSRHDVSSLVPVRYSGYPKYVFRLRGQDCWVIRGKPRVGMWLDFPMGKGHCDNRIAHELQAVGYDTFDPFLTVLLLHCHAEAARPWMHAASVPPPYAFPPPRGWREQFYQWYAPIREALEHRGKQVGEFARIGLCQKGGWGELSGRFKAAFARRWARIRR